MNKMPKWVMVSTIISTMLIGKIAIASTFTDALVNYCVPINASVCSGAERALYNSSLTGNKCECQRVGMYYDTTLTVRYCKNCPEGTITGTAKNLTSCKAIKCPSGFKVLKATNGVCASGFSLKTITNNSCPTGYKTYKFE
ncbi:hypothetical protein HDR59_04780 [bacterium]|nr:hypothetical protein [bacterium]